MTSGNYHVVCGTSQQLPLFLLILNALCNDIVLPHEDGSPCSWLVLPFYFHHYLVATSQPPDFSSLCNTYFLAVGKNHLRHYTDETGLKAENFT